MVANNFIGCDLGGTNLRAGMVNTDSGEISHLHVTETIARDGSAPVIRRIIQLLHEVMDSSGLSWNEIRGIGIGVPGVLDLDRGVVVFLPNLPGAWPGVPLAEIVGRQTGPPVFLLNDARAITYGEWKFGAGKGAESMACFAVGTGIGGGLVVDGKLVLGIGGTAGELGHQTMDPDGFMCGCGNRGCVEAYASGSAITAMGIKAVTQGLTTTIGVLAGYDLNKISPELICQAALNGDPVARNIYDVAGSWLGIAVSNILVTVGPRKVVIGGGVAQAGDLLLNPVRRTVKDRVRMMPVDQVEIVLAELGAGAGIVGVAAWARDQVARLQM